MVREWDPRTASSAEISSLLDCLNQVFRTDLPGDPLWRPNYLREYLTETMPGSRRVCWLAEEPAADGSPRIVGHVNVLLIGDIGVLEVLVHPEVRRTGLGRQLLALAVRRAYHEGFSSVGVEVIGGTSAIEFYGSLGFDREFREIRSVLRLSTVDWAAIDKMAGDAEPGYRVEFFPGGPPDELIDAYAQAKAEQRVLEEAGELDLRPSSYEPERLRESLDCLHRRGMKPYIVLAIHAATGEVAGLTEVVVPAQHPTRADQYDTIVVRAHRGRGIDRAIKARMLLELRSAEPELAEVQTWNAEGNETMLRVNSEIGFQPDRDWWDCGADIATLLRRLEAKG
ncbi:GNAT family N-acetyltransferase [Solwaraspora sp. WMMD406]|uniref:GNAT family N-acetyltransferase n=1 Tax=Solwaraspora sp. WMMD406 TaxID=3016095 RepID=UPI0024162569|nr:GNAT family N-acetyltransferase [Solwaraspora sp. WMMD406]MDG4768154.1 GNAT family N-acetyltransferase [Solwaraspora sp. WMMD406]